MKKILCIALALVMTAGVMAGCSSDKDPAPNNPPENSSSIDENINSTPENPDTSEPEVTEPVDSDLPEVTAGSANERLAIIIDRVRDEESKEAFQTQTNNDNGVLDLLGLTDEDITEYAVTYSPMNVHAYMIGVFKPAEARDDAVIGALKSYHQSMIKSFEQYLPDQLKIAEDAVIFTEDGYIGIVMCENSEDVKDNLTTGLSGIEEIKIVVDEDNTTDGEPTGDTNTNTVNNVTDNNSEVVESTDEPTGATDETKSKDVTDAAKDAVKNIQKGVSKEPKNVDGAITVNPDTNENTVTE